MKFDIEFWKIEEEFIKMAEWLVKNGLSEDAAVEFLTKVYYLVGQEYGN